MQIISADQRLAERRGVKALIVGPAGVGKTTLLRTLDPERTLLSTPKRAISRFRTCRSIPFASTIGRVHVISRAASAGQIRPFRLRRATRRRITMRAAAYSRTSTSTR